MKGGALSSTKKLKAKEIAILVKKLSVKKPKIKSPLILSSKCTKPKRITMVSLKEELSLVQRNCQLKK